MLLRLGNLLTIRNDRPIWSGKHIADHARLGGGGGGGGGDQLSARRKGSRRGQVDGHCRGARQKLHTIMRVWRSVWGVTINTNEPRQRAYRAVGARVPLALAATEHVTNTQLLATAPPKPRQGGPADRVEVLLSFEY